MCSTAGTVGPRNLIPSTFTSSSIISDSGSSFSQFADGAYWKKLDPEAEVIDEEVNVDGIRFRVPTDPAVEHENTTFEDRPKKRNYSDMFDRLPFIRETILLPQRTTKGMLTRTHMLTRFIKKKS